MTHIVMAVDWAGMFRPTVSLVELFLRGSAMYLAIFAVMRIFRRQKGALNAADFLVLVLIADAAQNALSADYHSLTEGAVVVGTIFFWDLLLDALSFISKPLNRLINGDPILLVKDGRLNRRNMRREMLTRDDVLEQLREQGVNDIATVQRCYLEADGHFSVIKEEEDDSVRPSNFAEGVA
jgi:uncharacterized membrane protein YcaP (DUF421 family)